MKTTERDQELMRRVAGGDGAALRQWIGEAGPRVMALVARLAGSRRDAEELCQDAFLKAVASIDRYDPAQAPPDAWLCRIAYRCAIDHLRRRRAKPAFINTNEQLLRNIPDDAADPALRLETEEQVTRLNQLLDRLPPEELTIVTLFYFENRSLADIGYIIGLRPGTVPTRLSRIRKKLWAGLEEG